MPGAVVSSLGSGDDCFFVSYCIVLLLEWRAWEKRCIWFHPTSEKISIVNIIVIIIIITIFILIRAWPDGRVVYGVATDR